ncbi:hypothetical protein T265_05912 [Opisthorchis viverrini]|uniref:Uncharacterized protein n=1 Tax=Opisthorchis viverrini TaxID=6198 RepID=A0A074ZIV3_OPIVI|nr:hypothetical protein T265_05912 [Opisthorchis viverrini]KER26926.1 hypothetical protein T265_05912 [Opisthorchis viverrini]
MAIRPRDYKSITIIVFGAEVPQSLVAQEKTDGIYVAQWFTVPYYIAPTTKTRKHSRHSLQSVEISLGSLVKVSHDAGSLITTEDKLTLVVTTFNADTIFHSSILSGTASFSQIDTNGLDGRSTEELTPILE